MIKTLRSFTQREKAFTLVELLIVIAIIAILTVAFLPNILKAPAKARDAIRVKQVSDIANAAEVYATERGILPPTESAANLVECVTSNIAGQLGINQPIDSKGLNSCSSAAPETLDGPAGSPKAKELLYYKYDDVNKFYIVAAKLENASAANTDATNVSEAQAGAADAANQGDGFDDVGTLADARALLTAKTKPDGTETDVWYIAVGPQ